jgi:membrane-associated phospholipid phosphatase
MSFAGPIEGGFWWGLVSKMVDDAGAMLDVFPELHTAFPTLFALHALRHRRTRPYRWLWPLSAFFALNIVPSTMLLRWHYAIDVVAGLVLAVGAHRIAIAVAAREPRRRRAGRQASFE